MMFMFLGTDLTELVEMKSMKLHWSTSAGVWTPEQPDFTYSK